jgi:hypothetical protein
VAQVGANCLLNAVGHGVWNVRASRIGFGIRVTSNESSSRFGRAFYAAGRVSSDFTVSILFGDNEGEYRAFANWMQDFGRKVADPDSEVKFMQVIYLPRNFVRSGFYKNGVTFGDSVAEISFGMNLTFVGAHSAEDYVDYQGAQSQFRGPKDSPFYPGGYQESGISKETELYFGGLNQIHDLIEKNLNESSTIIARGGR